MDVWGLNPECLRSRWLKACATSGVLLLVGKWVVRRRLILPTFLFIAEENGRALPNATCTHNGKLICPASSNSARPPLGFRSQQ